MDDIDISRTDNESVIRLTFFFPVTYITHALSRSGTLLQIKVQFPMVPDDSLDFVNQRETLGVTPTKALPLSEITFDGSRPDIKVVNFTFTRTVIASAEQGTDFRSLVIRVKTPQQGPIAVKPTKPAAPAELSSEDKALLDRFKKESPDKLKTLQSSNQAQKPGQASFINPDLPYVITLSISDKRPRAKDIPDNDILKKYRIYATQILSKGKKLYRLRLGFFKNTADAQKIRKQLVKLYPKSKIEKAPALERRESRITAIRISQPGVGGLARIPLTPKQIADLMNKARQAILEKKYTLATSLYSRVLASPPSPYHQEAKELLGLVRERRGQIAQAKAEYTEYLEKYPKGPDSDRVRQRLAGLVSAQLPERKLRQARGGTTRGKSVSQARTDITGSISQFFRYDASHLKNQPGTTDASLLINDVSLTSRTRKDDYDFRVQFNANYQHDFQKDQAVRGLSTSNLYFEGSNRKAGFTTRLGRQTRSSGGVLGRFDGGLLSYQLKKDVKINLVAGYPVNLSVKSNLQDDKYFYGSSLEFSNVLFKNLNFSPFAIHQVVDNITDRTAVGTEIRYLDKNQTYFSIIDYDVSYDKLTTFLFLSNYRFDNGATVNVQLDYRTSPILTTSNALQGQQVTDIGALLRTNTEDQIRQYAKDRSVLTRTATVSGTYPLNDKFQISADATVTNSSATSTSGGVDGTPAVGNDYFVSTQFIGRGLITKSDISIVGLRYSDTSTSKTTTFTANSNFRIQNKYRINPRFTFDYQKRTDNIIKRYRPEVRLEYRFDRRLNFEVDLGGEYMTDHATSSNDRLSYFIFAGYRKDFF